MVEHTNHALPARLTPYPWLAGAWQRFLQFGDRLPHALLIHGAEGIGKQALAWAAAEAMLMQGDEGRRAHSEPGVAHLFEVGSHPDFHLITTEWQAQAALQAGDTAFDQYAERYLAADAKTAARKPRRVISVDQIRDLINSYSRAAHHQAGKVALITPAERMNVNAANALLKLLEEPPAGGYLILCAHELSRLPMTVLSRCVRLPVELPQEAAALAYLNRAGVGDAAGLLALTGGAPLSAEALAASDKVKADQQLGDGLTRLLTRQGDAIQLADSLQKLELPWLLSRLQTMLVAAVRARLAPEHEATLETASMTSWLEAARRLEVSSLVAAYDAISALKQHDVTQLNAQLVLERLFLGLGVRAR